MLVIATLESDHVKNTYEIEHVKIYFDLHVYILYVL